MIYNTIKDRHELLNNILPNNPGIIIIKFTAEWCAPCKNIKDVVYQKFNNAPNNVACFDIDIDDNFDVYAYMKSKKMSTGVPTILVWKKGNTSFAPDNGITGGDPTIIHNFLSDYIP